MWIVCVFSIGCFVSFLSLNPSNQPDVTQAASPAVTLPSPLNVPISGQWQMEVSTESTGISGVALIKQENTVIYGEGQDGFGVFTIDGKVLSDRVTFIKRYDEDSIHRGAHAQDIEFSGMLSMPYGNGLILEGQYETQIKSGFATSYYRKSHWQTVTGRWTARKTGELPTQMPLQMERRQESWNPLRCLDAQPSMATGKEVQVDLQTQAQIEKQKEAYLFFTIVIATLATIGGCVAFLVVRYNQRRVC